MSQGLSPEKIYDNIIAGYEDWTDMSVKCRVAVDAPQGLSFSGQATMKRGSWIHFSLRMLGMEVAAAWIDNDSVLVVDKFHHRYISQPLDGLFHDSGVNVGDLQDFLTGRMFLAGSGSLTKADITRFNFIQDAAGVLMLPVSQPERYEYGFIASAQGDRLAAASVEIPLKAQGVVTYDGFLDTPGGVFAANASLSVKASMPFAASFSWDFSGAKFNTAPRKTPPSIRGYQKVDLGSILGKL